jgi:hypothetical protein
LVRQQRRHGGVKRLTRLAGAVDRAIGRKFPDHLPACAARRRGAGTAARYGYGRETLPAGRDGGANRHAFSTHAQAVAGVLDIAAGEYGSVLT